MINAEKWGPLGSLVAVACCLGGGPLLVLLAPLGLAFLVTDFVFVPLVVFFLAATLWSLQRSRRRHGTAGPLVLAALGSLLTLAGLFVWWLVVVTGVGLIQVGAIWNLVALRR